MKLSKKQNEIYRYVKQELLSDSIARLDELKGRMQCKVSSFDI